MRSSRNLTSPFRFRPCSLRRALCCIRVASPFWPKFLETRTLTPQQIGSILAAAMLVRLVSGPCVGRLADALGSLRIALASYAALAGAAVAFGS
ncbi:MULTISPECIES: MFS transporter [unclassified Bradyrhizobium]|uniref:MFS transporter n=1 Tax=unclassified Bradyrhizobium TaxID=2631580 RepID=UPI00209E5F05|nr:MULTISPECIES: MFS transporter [unclassified Bradyrhizobium]